MAHPSHTDDTKLLLAVAGLVVTGAAVLAIVAGLGSARDAALEDEAHAADRPVATAGSRIEPVTASDEAQDSESNDEAVMLARFEGSNGDDPAVTAPALPETPSEQSEFSIVPGENLVAEGVSAWSARDYPRAIAYFRAQTVARPDDAWAHYMVGLSLWKLDRLDESVQSLTRAAELNSSSIKTPINLSRVQNDRGDFEAALAAAKVALAIDAEDATALFLEGRSQRNLGRIDEAVTSLEASLAQDSENGFVHNLLGLIRIERGEMPQAVISLSRAAEFRPNVAFIQNNLGMALERTGDRVGAIAAYRRAVELDSDYGKAASSLARLEPLVPTESRDEDVAMARADSDVSSDSGGLD